MDEATLRKSRRYGTAQSAILLGYAAVSFFTPRNYLFVSSAASIAGYVVCGLGGALLLIAIHALRDTVQIDPNPKAGRTLLRTGIYRYFRHPIYTGIVISVAGLFLRQPTIWMALAGLAVIAFLAVKVRFEETLLCSVYPDYPDYRKQAWGLLPGLR